MNADKVWYRSRTIWTSILSLLAMWLASPELLNVVPSKYLIFFPLGGMVVKDILRSIPTPNQGGLTLTTDPTSVDPGGRKPTQ